MLHIKVVGLIGLGGHVRLQIRSFIGSLLDGKKQISIAPDRGSQRKRGSHYWTRKVL